MANTIDSEKRIDPAILGVTENSQATTEKPPFAFDLQIEYDNALQFGDLYKDYFIEQANFYAGEYYGKVPIKLYRHYLSRDVSGKVTLQVGPQRDSARKSYEKPVWDTSLPLWYRQRAATDVNWTTNIEELLQVAQVGDMFIDMSPTEFQVDIEERKKRGFGWHSFIRLHQLVEENGQEVLYSKAIRDYLDLQEQVELFKQFSGTKINPYDLLGKVAKIPLGINAGHIKKMADDLYDATPVDRKITPEGDEISKEEAEMNSILRSWQPWLERIFDMMKRGVSPDMIVKEFHGWEMAIKDAVRGETVNIPSLGSIDPQNFTVIDPSIIRHYTSQEYAPVGGSCGSGSGIKNKNPYGIPGLVVIEGGMIYQSMTVSTTKDKSRWKYHKGKCIDCGRGEEPAGPNSIEVGDCNICRDCEKKYDAQEESDTNFDSQLEYGFEMAA